jgi:hypothetical protein
MTYHAKHGCPSGEKVYEEEARGGEEKRVEAVIDWLAPFFSGCSQCSLLGFSRNFSEYSWNVLCSRKK